MSSRTRPRLFSFSREIELGHYDEIVRSGEPRAALEAVIDAFAEICSDRRLTPERLEPVARGAVHDDPTVRMVAMHRLAVLTHYFEPAIEAWALLVEHPDEEVRLLASAMVSNVPVGVAPKLLERFLADHSWRVRKAAAQVGGAIPVPDLADVLTDAMSRERDARVRVVLQLALGFQEEQARRAL